MYAKHTNCFGTRVTSEGTTLVKISMKPVKNSRQNSLWGPGDVTTEGAINPNYNAFLSEKMNESRLNDSDTCELKV